jgi:metal-responsive CopG/Arc/MetJ family transcriptional regulator
MHVHLNVHDYLEAIAAKGEADEIKKLAEKKDQKRSQASQSFRYISVAS